MEKESVSSGTIPEPVAIDYTNYKGERALRLVMPEGIFWGSTKYHPTPQWLLRAIDVSRGVSREFALASVHSWGQAKVVGVTPVPLKPEEQERVKEKYGASLVDYCQSKSMEYDELSEQTQPVFDQIEKTARAEVWKEVAELLRQRGIE